MTLDIDKLISSFRLRVRMKSPFFATLSLFAVGATSRLKANYNQGLTEKLSRKMREPCQ
jgi:hypothetical protein